MSNDDDCAPDEANRTMAAWGEANLRASAERAEHDPWVREYHRVAAKVAETGNQSLFADYTRRFHASLAMLYPPETYAKW